MSGVHARKERDAGIAQALAGNLRDAGPERRRIPETNDAEVGQILAREALPPERVEEIAAAASGPLWFQLYAYRDRDLTRRLSAVGELVGIRVHDHIVVGDGEYVSFLDRGWIS